MKVKELKIVPARIMETAASQRDRQLHEIEDELRPLTKRRLRKRLAEHMYTSDQSRRDLAVQQRRAALR